ncbi:MAG: hypothetical protein ACRELA_20090 [Candidatus Rokuibacteriota bacterium]
MSQKPLLFGLAMALACAGPALAGPVEVRYQEGVSRAFPTLKSVDNEKLADGEFIQVAHGDRVVNRLVFRFKDGSLHDETVVYSQRGVFNLLTYRLVQRGRSFPETIEAFIDRATERYEVRYRADDDSPEEHLTGRFTLPNDIYNGMLCLIVKNLSPGTTETVSIVAFTPKPRVVQLKLQPVAEEGTRVGGMTLSSTRYHIRPQLGLFASLLVTDIPDMRVWVVPGEAPAFLRAEGPLFFMGPVWRIEPN